MKDREDILRMGHMIRSIDKIEKYTADIDFNNFEQNEMAQDAVFKNLEIIGEAAYKISNSTKELYEHIEWRKIEGLRNKLVHDYYQVDLEIVWNTKNNSLPILKNDIEEILKTMGREIDKL